MRIIFAAIAVFILTAFIVGKIVSGRHATLRQAFAKGAYYVGITVLAFGAIAAVIAIVYDLSNSRGRDHSGPLAGMDESRKVEFLDSLYHSPPLPSSAELETIVIDYDFENSALPCYESVHVFDVASLKEIVSLQKTDESLADQLFEVNVIGQFRTNKPLAGFHLKASLDIQYRFSDGSREKIRVGHFPKS